LTTQFSEQSISSLLDKKDTTLNVGQVIRWIRLDRHIMQILTFVCIMAIPSKSTISGVTPYLLTSMATICSASTTVVVVKSEDLEFLVWRDN
jgi:hypothetical protein